MSNLWTCKCFVNKVSFLPKKLHVRPTTKSIFLLFCMVIVPIMFCKSDFMFSTMIEYNQKQNPLFVCPVHDMPKDSIHFKIVDHSKKDEHYSKSKLKPQLSFGIAKSAIKLHYQNTTPPKKLCGHSNDSRYKRLGRWPKIPLPHQSND